eukprot:TRINITY_DN48672_c0_g1_i1.p1 TRINITY_DN48672_c0_g1~~TRINITY_DN48672_c0_g1_i1.p1  ORF type:complete len:340 (+),score=104.37 TRINITY_DN48672_c0_g1_i1:28-1020(+)
MSDNIEAKWKKIQENLAASVSKQDEAGLRMKVMGGHLVRVAGVDLSFPREKVRRLPSGDEDADTLAAAVVMEYKRGAQPKVVGQFFVATVLKEPYIPNYLAFREVGPLKKLLAHIKEKAPDIYPDVVLVDGNGILHARKCGLASHLGVETKTPTIGVAKKLLCVSGLSDSDATDPIPKEAKYPIRGRIRRLVTKNEECLGVAYRADSPAKSRKPKFISSGHMIDLRTAISIVDMCCEPGLSEPSPIRYADRHGRYLLTTFGTPRKAARGKVNTVIEHPNDTFASAKYFDDLDCVCSQCASPFVCDAGEQEFHHLKGFKLSSKCKACRGAS